MAYTEILVPQAYVADPGVQDFCLDSDAWYFASAHPAEAVSAMLSNDTPLPPPFGIYIYGAYRFSFGADHGNGRFVMSNPVINGEIQNVALRFLTEGTGAQWMRIWTHATQYEIAGALQTYIGQSLYPVGVGWGIYEYVWLVNPFTTVAWTLAELNDLNGGFRLFAAPLQWETIDQLFVLVTYSKVPPVVATQAASGVIPGQATLNGSLTDDGGEVCTLSFQWGASPSLGNTVAAGTGSTGASFSVPITGLLASNYYFRAVATNSRGTSYGAILSLTSTGGGGEAVTVLTLPAVEVTENGGKLRGLVQDSLGRYGEVRFEWGGTTAYGNTTPWEQGYKSGDMFEARLLNLAEGAVYHFRAQYRGSGIVSGSDAAFTTLSNLGAVTFIDEETLSRLEET